MEIHRAGVAVIGLPPDLLEDGLALEDDALIPNQKQEQIVLLGREGDLFAAAIHRTGKGVDADPSRLQEPFRFVVTPQDGFHAGEKLLQVEGLGDIVLRA
jgi:hypothetical protein